MLRRADNQIQALQSELAELKQTIEESNKQKSKETENANWRWNHQFQAVMNKVEQLKAEKSELRQIADASNLPNPQEHRQLPDEDTIETLRNENTLLKTELREIKNETKILGEALLVTQQQLAYLQKHSDAKLEEKMHNFWLKSAKLEEHLEAQFKLQEDNLELLKQEFQSSVRNEYEKLMDTWDNQFEELVKYIEDHKSQQNQRSEQLEKKLNDFDILQEQNSTTAKDSKEQHDQLLASIQEIENNQEKVTEDLHKHLEESLKEVAASASDKVDSIIKAVRQEMVHLEQLKNGHKLNALVRNKKNMVAHVEFEGVVKEAKIVAGKLQSLYTELDEVRSEFYKSELRREKHLDRFRNDFEELTRKVALQTRALKTSQQSVKEALREKKSIESELQVSMTLYRESIEELNQLQEESKQNRQTTKLPTPQFIKIKKRVDDILKDPSVDEGCEVEARDAET